MNVSVIILNYNGIEYMAECLDALKHQTYRQFETIVVDNGSTDGSLEELEQRTDIRLIALSTNTGFTGGVNAGIRATQSTYIALLNNDAVAHKDWLGELVKAMEVADIAAAKILHFDNHELIDTTGDHMSKWGIPYPRDRGQKDTHAYSGYPEIFSACGGASIYKRVVFDQLGLLDTAFFAYLEDTDISFRAQLTGHKIVLAPKAEVYHHIGATSGKMGHFGRYQFIKNSHFVFYKNFPLGVLVRHLPRFAFIQLLLLAAAAKNGAFGTALRAYVAVIAHIPQLLRDRRAIQRMKVLSDKQVEALLTDHWPLRTRIVSGLARKL